MGVLALIVVGWLLASPAPPSPCLLAPVRAPVVDAFRPPGCPWCPGNRGLEYATAPGTPVRAGTGGVVQFAGLVARVRYVVVAHPSGLRSTYGRLAESTVKEGDTVSPGQVLGRSGTRVFFGIRHGTVYLDPTRYLLRRVGSPRLVPTDGSPARPPDPARRPAGRLSCTARSPGR